MNYIRSPEWARGRADIVLRVHAKHLATEVPQMLNEDVCL